jgi:hypothetical protein
MFRVHVMENVNEMKGFWSWNKRKILEKHNFLILTAWTRVFNEKITDQFINKSSATFGTQILISVLAIFRHFALAWVINYWPHHYALFLSYPF